MASIPVTVPDVWSDDKSKEGVIVNWFYEEGARVAAGTVIAEGMVEKVNFEIQAPASGVLRTPAPVNTPIVPGKAIARIETEG
ncbi:MAG TPA: lipoyl domain-containing protein [Anaeromyxobacter sp.]|jgi:pyruvate/2-oxoglutarate dehydrogenase complex dihydrolipoamide acyltransferase (E2) component|nr:lipoyl domain-containing protein [Anaeromyxobacter sp.]